MLLSKKNGMRSDVTRMVGKDITTHHCAHDISVSPANVDHRRRRKNHINQLQILLLRIVNGIPSLPGGGDGFRRSRAPLIFLYRIQ